MIAAIVVADSVMDVVSSSSSRATIVAIPELLFTHRM
jgi:hypothetical protein